jgi:hypothetical protein
MKKHFLHLIFLFSFLIGHFAYSACVIQPLTSQAQIDNFATTYSNCTVITNGLYVNSGFDITNLNGLSAVTSAAGLYIENNPRLTDISGLSNITITGHLNIENNSLLTNLDGLESFTSSGDFRVVFNNSLQNVSGLKNLTTVSGFFFRRR